jgi:hypothetical protein
MTPLDTAHAAMQDGTDHSRLKFYECFADGEVFVLLEGEAQDDKITPALLTDKSTKFVIVFDRELRLSHYAGGVAPQVTLSGRGVVEMLKGQGIGIALNPGAASDTLIAPQSVDWLAQTLANPPSEHTARPTQLRPPGTVPPDLMAALDRKLASARGLASAAWLAGVVYDDASEGHLLAFVDAMPDAQPALANAVAEALTFSGVEAGALDVTFITSDQPITARLAKVGLRFDLPMTTGPRAPQAPGTDPNSPPKLR